MREQVHDAVWDLIRWTEGRWRFRKNEKTREDVAPPMTVQELLENLRERGVEWEAISDVVHGPTAVPVLSARGGGAPETTLDADAWSMLCKIDGERSVAELARDCGYTLFEAGQVLVHALERPDTLGEQAARMKLDEYAMRADATRRELASEMVPLEFYPEAYRRILGGESLG